MMIGQYTIGHNSFKDPNFNLPFEIWRKLVFSYKDLYLSNKALEHRNCPREVIEEVLNTYISPNLSVDNLDSWKVTSALRSPNITNEFFNEIILRMCSIPSILLDTLSYQLLIGWVYDERITPETLDKIISVLSDKKNTITNHQLDQKKDALLRAFIDNPNVDINKFFDIKRAIGDISKEDPSKHKIEYTEKPQQQQGTKELEDLLAQSFNWYRLAKETGKTTRKTEVYR